MGHWTIFYKYHLGVPSNSGIILSRYQYQYGGACLGGAQRYRPPPLHFAPGTSVRLVFEEVIKALHFDNSHNSFLWPEYFFDFYVKDGSHVRLKHPSCVYILPPRDSTQQYQRCVNLWNNVPCIITLVSTNQIKINLMFTIFSSEYFYYFIRQIFTIKETKHKTRNTFAVLD